MNIPVFLFSIVFGICFMQKKQIPGRQLFLFFRLFNVDLLTYINCILIFEKIVKVEIATSRGDFSC